MSVLGTRGSVSDALCLCEYYNRHGERSHLLACCCDCEALDSVCDRLLTCKRIDPDLYSEMWKTILDRVRLPTLTGKGAVRVQPDLIIPIILVPLALLVGTINEFFTVFSLLGMPAAVLFHYTMWSRKKVKDRPRIFYVWGLTSVFTNFCVFLFVVVGFRKILLWELMLEVTLFGILMFMLKKILKDPGIVRRQGTSSGTYDKDNMQPSIPPSSEARVHMDGNNDSMSEMGRHMLTSFGFNEESVQEHMDKEIQLERERQDAAVVLERQVNWVDSRPLSDGVLKTWCEICQMRRPPRSGHCTLCNVCIYGRDHHCVWVDSCVGAANHRAFYGGLIFLLLSGFYGVHLTLTTVCTPSMYLDWFLFPTNCDFVYSDLPTALSFVSACYTTIFCTLMACVYLVQTVLISQNLTSQELHQAAYRGWVHFGCWASNNLNNNGCINNWRDFLTGFRHRRHQYGTLKI